jgi:predicted nucleotidyltransferase
MLKDKYKKIILDICNKHLSKPYKLYLFGSRARGDDYFCSDIDLAIQVKEENKNLKYALISEDLEESNIPLYVDLVDMDIAGEDFLQSIQKEGQALV